jgi:uncharacterized OB-fold protein
MTMPETRPNRSLRAVDRAFWDWCGKGELRLQRCTCGELAWPPVEACEACGGTALEWTPMSGEGRLVSWCSFERDYYAGRFPLPWDTIVVELAEGPLFLSNPLGFSVAEAQAGMPLRLAFIDCADDAGAFRLPVFERG